jgi:hypothetical protein
MGAVKKIDLIKPEKAGEGIMAQCAAEVGRRKTTV